MCIRDSFLFCFIRLWHHPFDAGEYINHHIVKETGKGGVNPFLGFLSAFAVLFISQIMDVFGTMKKIQYFLYGRKYFANPVPYPNSPVTYSTQSDFFFRNQT